MAPVRIEDDIASSPTYIFQFVISNITGDLDEVPGVTQLAKRKLAEAEDNIQTTHQLLGKFLSLKGKETDYIEHCYEFYQWLETIGINSYRKGIVLSIGEKVHMMMPEIYEGSLHNNPVSFGQEYLLWKDRNQRPARDPDDDET